MNPETPLRILCVDDSLAIQKITRIALEKIGGFSVSFCDSGRKVLAQAKTVDPDLILLDAVLPGGDGLEIFSKLAQDPQTRGISVIFLTAKSEPQELLRYRNTGALAVLRKPFDPFRLADQLRCIWEDYQSSLQRSASHDSLK